MTGHTICANPDCQFRFCSYPSPVRPWIPEIIFFNDTVPHAAALNMAIDEALLPVLPAPLLRVYRWAGPAVSFGYFERWLPILSAHPLRDPVRRWTGGGVVLHGDDLTYSLLIPAANPAAVLTPSSSYALIHTALRAALADAGIPTSSASFSSDKVSQSCFENPVPHDILLDGKKVAGAAQRRTRHGLIHQGSIQSLPLPETFPHSFATHLSRTVHPHSLDILPAAEKLAAEKYATRPWLEKRL